MEPLPQPVIGELNRLRFARDERGSARPAAKAEAGMSGDPAMLGTSGYDRIKGDAYYTPACVTEALLLHIEFPNTVWEPAAGRGDMSAVLRAAGYRVIESDIAWPESVDFLSQTALPESVRAIATNPPFDPAPRTSRPPLVEKFIRHALGLTRSVDGVVAMLARNELDCAGSRTDLFDRPPFAVKLVLTRRPRWVARHHGDKSPRHNFAWFIWDWEHVGPGVLRYAA
jgi:hypothetical protein